MKRTLIKFLATKNPAIFHLLRKYRYHPKLVGNTYLEKPPLTPEQAAPDFAAPVGDCPFCEEDPIKLKGTIQEAVKLVDNGDSSKL